MVGTQPWNGSLLSRIGDQVEIAVDDIMGSSAVSVAVLAGGRGSRMGGVDKGLLQFHGRRAVEWVLESVSAKAPRVVIANRNLAAYRRLGLRAIPDLWPDFRGPLAGIYTALRASGTPWVQFLPCDGLALPPDLSKPLLHATAAAGALAAFPVYGARGQYPCCIVHRDLSEAAEKSLHAGACSLKRWLASVDAVPVEFPRLVPEPIWSVNTLEELEGASERFARLGPSNSLDRRLGGPRYSPASQPNRRSPEKRRGPN